MIISAAFFAVMNIEIRYVDDYPTLQLVFFRGLGSVIMCFLVIHRLKISPWGKHRKLLLLRAFFGTASIVFFYKTLQIMPLASAVSLRYLAPIFAAFLAIIFLKEKIKAWQWFFFMTAFLGVVLLKGFDPRIEFIPLILSLVTAAFSGMVYVTIRRIGDRENPSVIILYFMLLTMITGAMSFLIEWKKPEGLDWIVLISIGFLGYFAQYFMTRAMQTSESNLISPFKYVEVVFTMIFGWMIYGEYQTLLTIFAMAIIVVSLIGNVYVKSKSLSKN